MLSLAPSRFRGWTSLVSGPHDSMVKALFANTEDAASALALTLPTEIADRTLTGKPLTPLAPLRVTDT
jgi:hypothetical protein